MTAAIAMAPPLDAHSASVNIPVNRILRSPFNRQPEVSDDFIANIGQNGVIQPVIVREVKINADRIDQLPKTSVKVGDDVYELVAGERRWLAAKANKHASIPAVIRTLTDTQAMEIQIAENDHRENYQVMDRAEAYDRLRTQYMLEHKSDKSWTAEKCMDLIATRCSQEHIRGRTVQQIIALKKLSTECQMALRKGEIEASHGYELCRRTVEDQSKLLLWLRQQTHHSQGDIPSVRRLKREIVEMDRIADEQRRQEKLFREPQPGTATTPTPTIDDVMYQTAISHVRGTGEQVRYVTNQLLQRRLKVGSAAAQDFLLRMQKDGIIGSEDDRGHWPYIFPKSPSDCDHLGTSPAQTSAAKSSPQDGRTKHAIATYKPPTKAQLKAEEQQEAQSRKAQEAYDRRIRIHVRYQGLLFAALASKAHVCSRLLTYVVPDLLVDVWKDEIPIEDFAQNVLQWPAPAVGGKYSYNEVTDHAEKHTRKFTPKLLAALLITFHCGDPDVVRLAKYFGVDTKKLGQKAAAAVKEEEAREEARARLPKVPVTQKEKQLHRALHSFQGNEATWNKLRKTGATNAELKIAIGQAIGDGGSHTEIGSVQYKGGADPAVWFNCMNRHNGTKPSLRGVELLAAVRDLLKIPEKGDVDA